MIQKINQQEYAKKIGVAQPAISYRLNNGLPLPGVKKIERFKRFYILHFDDTTDLDAAKNNFKIL